MKEKTDLSPKSEKLLKIVILIMVPLGLLLFSSLYVFSYLYFEKERFITFIICYSLFYLISLILAFDFCREIDKTYVKCLVFAWSPLINLFVILVPIILLSEFSWKKISKYWELIKNWFISPGNL